MLLNSKTNATLGHAPASVIQSFATLDLRAGVKALDDRWSFSIWGRNVTNSYYWTNVRHAGCGRALCGQARDLWRDAEVHVRLIPRILPDMEPQPGATGCGIFICPAAAYICLSSRPSSSSPDTAKSGRGE
ncbi:hypothetical protein [Sphingobium sp. CFD-1]|uniref:hypothetical protein n=1 Tax=Sphingobium sp. CFD-1 TaxID=2878545 RepID=UPI00214C0CB2|nr:hypothetical protein [Sphingobium sp. CFD-1]